MKMIFDPLGAVIKNKHPEGNIADIRDAGFSQVLLDFRMTCPSSCFLHMTRSRSEAAAEGDVFLPDEPDRMGETVQPFLDVCRKLKIQVPGAMAPVIPSDRSNPVMNDYQRALSFASVRCAMDSGCGWCIVPPLFVGVPLEKEKSFFQTGLIV